MTDRPLDPNDVAEWLGVPKMPAGAAEHGGELEQVAVANTHSRDRDRAYLGSRGTSRTGVGAVDKARGVQMNRALSCGRPRSRRTIHSLPRITYVSPSTMGFPWMVGAPPRLSFQTSVRSPSRSRKINWNRIIAPLLSLAQARWPGVVRAGGRAVRCTECTTVPRRSGLGQPFGSEPRQLSQLHPAELGEPLAHVPLVLLPELRARALLRLPGLTAGDAAQALLLLKELRPEPVQRYRTGTAERLGDRLIVSARQRCFDGDLQFDGVCDLASGRRIALSFENLRQQTRNGRSQSHASNPHRPDATGLDEPVADAADVFLEQDAAELGEISRRVLERRQDRRPLRDRESKNFGAAAVVLVELCGEVRVVDKSGEFEDGFVSNGDSSHEHEHMFFYWREGCQLPVAGVAA